MLPQMAELKKISISISPIWISVGRIWTNDSSRKSAAAGGKRTAEHLDTLVAEANESYNDQS